MVGVHLVLAMTPIWVTAFVLFILVDGAFHIGRDAFEGLPYQVAYSAKIGDYALVMAVLIAAPILQRGGAQLIPWWLQTSGAHLSIMVASFLIGITVYFVRYKMNGDPVQLMDMYHDIIVVPILLLFGGTLSPVIFLNGTSFEMAAVSLLVFLWLTLVVYDIRTQRMNQRNWLQNSGATFRPNLRNRER